MEFVAQDRAAFETILADKMSVAHAFDKGIAKKDEIEKALKKYRKDFDLDKFGVVMP